MIPLYFVRKKKNGLFLHDKYLGTVLKTKEFLPRRVKQVRSKAIFLEFTYRSKQRIGQSFMNKHQGHSIGPGQGEKYTRKPKIVQPVVILQTWQMVKVKRHINN